MSPLALASPASLKGVLDSASAARHLAAGLRRSVDADELPVADGGEGTAAVLHAALGGEWRAARVSDPLGRPVTARWLVLPDGTAVVDSAEAVGLPLVGVNERDPLRASTRGLGELLLAILAEQPSDVLVGVGGTATVDGGAGMRDVVGSALRDARVRVLCDVRNPLLGERGAARVFGPQKGADAQAVEELERRLASLAELEPFRDVPGAGAGGGLGAGFAALGAELCDGASRRARRDRLRRARAARRPRRHRRGHGRSRRRSRARRPARSCVAAPRSASRAFSSAVSSATASTRGRCPAIRGECG